uniref:zinc ribbon domain-containing protein n=1 Tax=Mariniphaga sp. TaxID=1954475 RepID=UPI003564EB8F
MYCKKCGSQLNENSTFCKYCGASQTSVTASVEIANEVGETSTEDQKSIITKHKIFHSDSEILIDTLGSGFLSSLFAQKSFSKSIVICSNKRIYQKGKLFRRNPSGKITYYHGEQCVDLREVTGISFLVDDPVNRLVFSFISLFGGIIGLVLASEQRGDIAIALTFISGA